MQIQGRVYFDHGLPAGGMRLRFYHHGFGGVVSGFGEVAAAEDGAYAFEHVPRVVPVNLEVRAVGADGHEVSLTETMYRVGEREVLNLVVPAGVRPLTAEFQRLGADVGRHLAGHELAEAREGEERRDLSLLHQSARWDARLIAFGATAGKLAAIMGVDQQALYGMFRVGLPTEPEQLARVSRAGVGHALRKANEAGVTTLSERDIETAQATFEAFARDTRRQLIGAGLLSNYGDMLAASGLSTADQDRFDDIYSVHRGTVEELWRKVRDAGLPVEPLRLTARLGYLTLNNAALVTPLRGEIRDSDSLTAYLVGQRLYQPDTWIARLRNMARDDESGLAALIPPSYTGTTVHQRLAAYGADLARKVRRSYPTHVIAHMVTTDQLRLGAARADVATLLTRAAEVDGFTFGRTPIGAFVRDNGPKLFNGMPTERAAAAVKQIKTLYRLYQITPTDEALALLLHEGFNSAYDVTAMPKDAFLRRYSGQNLLSQQQVELVYAKAQQVTTTVYNFFGTAKQLHHPPPVHAISGAPEEVGAAKDNLIKHYPTMERLFGDMDFGECEHCQSVFSPAAYFVDILKFLDPDPTAWGNQAAQRPFDVLAKRRPDLQALPLTCENTHTALPYIDIVNEILEYYLVHDQLGPEIAYDTGTAATDDLVAEPRHLLKDAYEILKNAWYPLTLPFDLWLETVRRFGEQHGTPLWQLLDALRPVDELDAPSPDAYGHRAVFRERLGIGAAEYRIFHGEVPWHSLYGYDDESTALDELASAKALSRRLRVSYRELVAVLKTGFVNPRLSTMVELRKFGVGIEDALRYLEQPGHPPFTPAERAAFEERLTPNGIAWLQQAFAAGDFARILVLADTEAGGSFEQTILRYADGAPVDGIALLIVNLLVRLWRRLGWSIEETGRTLAIFLPRDPDPWSLGTIGVAMATALLGIAHYDTVGGLLKTGKKGRPALVYLWSDLDDTRVAELFGTGSADTRDEAFNDDGLGHYFTNTVPLREHLPGLQAALNLSAEEIGQILSDANLTVADAPLDMPTISLLHRYGLLAKLLKLPVAELIALEALSGLHPFTPPHPTPVTSIGQDHAYSQTQRFVEVAALVKESGLGVTDLDFLLRHRFDPVGPYRSAVTAPLGLARTLADEIKRIRAEHAAPDDALSFTDDLLQQKLALVFPPDVVATFLGMWQGSVEYQAAVLGIVAEDALDPADFAGEPAISLSYNETTQTQTLTYRGVLLDDRRAALLATHPQQLFALLLDQIKPKQFFERYLQKTVVGAVPTGFLEPADFDLLFVAQPQQLEEAVQKSRRAKLVSAFLPYLQHRLIEQFVVRTVATDLGTEPDLARTLVAEPTVLDDPDQAGTALLASYIAIGDPGVDETHGADSVRLTGYVEVPTTGAYRFFVQCGQSGTRVELRFDHLTDPLLRATAATDGAEPSEYTELKAGVLYGFTVDATAVDGGQIALFVQGEQVPKGAVAQTLTTRSRSAMTRLHRAHLLVDKVIRLAAELELTERELRHFSVHRADFDDFDLGALPTRPGEDGQAESVRRFGWLLRLAGYLRLRRELTAEPDELVDLLAAARRVYSADADPLLATAEVRADLCDRLATLTRRDPIAVAAAADLLNMAGQATPAAGQLAVTVPGFADERGVGRLWTVLALARKLGVAPDALGRWATPTPDAATAQDLRDTVKARYEPATWRPVARSIFDKLRRLRRDALVAHIMHTDGFDRVEQLFEHFLVDPATEPVVLTSRLRLAISSVQTFIQRCQLNLEQEVSPSLIDSARWAWMRRYRVWEANRKVFVRPANWLEPEWRDDKSHLFTALESELLQGDLNEDLAESAFFGYLHGLRELARLDIRATYLEEKADPAANVLHVVARTFGSPYKYFYRTYAHQMWTPWVPVTAEIDGNHLAVVVWRGRVHLFWVTFLPKEPKPKPTKTQAETTMDKVTLGDVGMIKSMVKYEVKLGWSEYFQEEWTDPTSSGFLKLPALPLTGQAEPTWPLGTNPDTEFIHATATDDEVRIHFTGTFNRAFRVVSKNSPASLRISSPPDGPPYPTVEPGGQGRYLGESPLAVTYLELAGGWDPTEGGSPPMTAYHWQILGKGSGYSLITHADQLHGLPERIGFLVAPFFYADERHTFYVEPTFTEETTIQRADSFVVAHPNTLSDWDDTEFWQGFDITGQVTAGEPLAEVIGAAAKFALAAPVDWATKAENRVRFDGVLIGPGGSVVTTTVQQGRS